MRKNDTTVAKEIAMICPRCAGLLISQDVTTGFYDENAWLSLQGYRCVNCGYREDPVIRMNRLPRTATVRGRPGKIPQRERARMYESCLD